MKIHSYTLYPKSLCFLTWLLACLFFLKYKWGHVICLVWQWGPPSSCPSNPPEFHLTLLSLILFNEGKTLVLHLPLVLKLYVLSWPRVWLILFLLFGTVVHPAFSMHDLISFSPSSTGKFTCNFQIMVDYTDFGWLRSIPESSIYGPIWELCFHFYDTHIPFTCHCWLPSLTISSMRLGGLYFLNAEAQLNKWIYEWMGSWMEMQIMLWE